MPFRALQPGPSPVQWAQPALEPGPGPGGLGQGLKLRCLPCRVTNSGASRDGRVTEMSGANGPGTGHGGAATAAPPPHCCGVGM